MFCFKPELFRIGIGDERIYVVGCSIGTIWSLKTDTATFVQCCVTRRWAPCIVAARNAVILWINTSLVKLHCSLHLNFHFFGHF